MSVSEKLTLRDRMIAGAITAVFIPFLVAGTTMYIQLSHALTKTAEKEVAQIARDISGFVDIILRHKLKLAASLAADTDTLQAAKTGDYHVVHDELRSILRSIGDDILSLYVVDRYGINQADPRYPQQIGLDLSDRQYFQKARAGQANVTEPFLPRCVASPCQPVMVVSAPIQEGDTVLGVLCIAFHADSFIRQVSRKQFTQTGRTFLVNENGLVLLHPQEDCILKARLLGQPGTESLARLLKTQSTGTADCFFAGSERIAGVARVGLTGWSVIFSQSRDEIMAPVTPVLSAIVLGGLIFLVIAGSTIIFYFNRIGTPIQKMMEMIEQVACHSTEIVIQVGRDRKIFYANQAFEKITGIRSAAVLGTEPDLTQASIPPGAIWERLESGTSWSGRLVQQSDATVPLTLAVILVPLRDRQGAIQSYLEIGRDISKEVMFEKRLAQTQKLESIGTLAGGIAHDFNNILGVIFSYAELLRMNHTGNPRSARHIQAIIHASERARDLIAQILTFSRKTDVDLQPLIPKCVLKEASKLLRASIPATIDIQVDLNSEATVMAEPTQLYQIVMNLVANAAQAIGERVGTIQLRLQDVLVDDAFIQMNPGAQAGKHVLLQVSDTGPGMEPDIQDQIFEPFFTTKPTGQGTGLGLSVVHGIVKKFNGIITVDSTVGHGTTFNIFIPYTDAVKSSRHSSDLRIQGGTERIALIDDQPVLAASLEAILTTIGYRVTVFTDSLAALAALTSSPGDFDLVITDYSMPQATGLEIARRIQQAGLAIPVILTSGYISVDMEKTTSEAGVAALIAKPINTYRLARAIREVL